MAEENHTIRLLTEMRGEIRDGFEHGTRERSDLREQLQRVDERFEEAQIERAELRRRVTESETRVATELVAVHGAVDGLKGLVMQHSSLKRAVVDHDRRIRKLESE